ncbi:hypothetical protein PVAND_009816 [Polypedilum vanderplanki]|uniref:Uncharacterized protein n=1 Tax=Polypedilum vanderplanki TaxID=319348 RepID=A0A9J6CEU2_POLVA|nr:hypothetical protein PVAND_009816 [Polypedilum vanderplanki]
MATYVVEGEASESEDEQYSFNLSYMKIGNENNLESPNVAINNAKELILKGIVIDGLTETQELLNTPVATEITEDFFSSEIQNEPTNDALRNKINEISTVAMKNFIQEKIAPISKKMLDTDNSLVNTQLTLSNVSTSMKTVSDNTEKINKKFHNLIDTDFLPKINKVSSP